MSKYQKLTKAEEEIMQMLWQQVEPLTVSQLILQMQEPHPPHSTVSSIIRILQKKGFVNHKAYGRTHVYFPVVDKKEYTKFSISKLVGNYFEGSMNELVSFLVKENDLSIKDLGQIIQKLDDDKDE
jgi:Predicted transcriptional regulator